MKGNAKEMKENKEEAAGIERQLTVNPQAVRTTDRVIESQQETRLR